MQVKFGVDQKNSPVIPVETQQTAKTTAEVGKVEVVTLPDLSAPSQLPATREQNSGFVFGDDLPGFREVMFPRLNIVQAIGKLMETFTPGELVFGQSTVLFTPSKVEEKTGNVKQKGTPPVNLTVLGIVSKRFSEKITGGIGGQIVNTESEVVSAGGTLNYKEWELKQNDGMKRFEPLIDLLITIRRPEVVADDDTVFSFDVDGHKYALGLWSVKGTAYTAAYKKVFAFHRLAGVLKGGYPTYNFNVSVRLEKYPNGNMAWVPVVIPGAKSSPAFLDFAKQILNPSAE
jgi:hypothetical protein